MDDQDKVPEEYGGFLLPPDVIPYLKRKYKRTPERSRRFFQAAKALKEIDRIDDPSIDDISEICDEMIAYYTIEMKGMKGANDG